MTNLDKFWDKCKEEIESNKKYQLTNNDEMYFDFKNNRVVINGEVFLKQD